MPKVRSLLYDHNIYDGFSGQSHDFDDHGWGGKREFFTNFVIEYKPSLIIEVGTWKGQSALTMARAMRLNNIKGEIVCIDTWLGSSEHWLAKNNYNKILRKNRYKSLNFKNGYPSLYYQFLANVCHEHAQGIITPLPTTSLNAAEILKNYQIKADAIYIDAGHSYEEVKLDINAFGELASDKCFENGLFFGDDYQSFPDVAKAVKEYASKHKLEIMVEDNLWRLKK